MGVVRPRRQQHEVLKNGAVAPVSGAARYGTTMAAWSLAAVPHVPALPAAAPTTFRVRRGRPVRLERRHALRFLRVAAGRGAVGPAAADNGAFPGLGGRGGAPGG
ncbi:hypothetical protein GCM10009731_53090 [Streptomyces globosus]